MTLNIDQKNALKLLNDGKNVFLSGIAGVGKTFILKKFIEDNKGEKNMGITSTTGISATTFNATTLHSFLGIGLGKGSVETLSKKICGDNRLFNRWNYMDILIIDEISMLDPDLFDKLEKVARVVRGNSLPFGGIQLILSGDFCQLTPVGTDKFCFEAKSWNRCIDEVIYLTKVVRQQDEMFQKFLYNIRVGNLDKKTKEILKSRLNVELKNNLGIEPTILYNTNRDVDSYNEEKLTELNNDIYQYDILLNNVKDKKAYGIIPEKLLLCESAQVMLIYNLDIPNGLINGSRGIVIGFIDDYPIVRFMNGQEHIIKVNKWSIQDKNGDEIGSISQIPLKLAWAITIHKSQSMTIDYCVVDLYNTFIDNQAYVALSRVKSLEGLSINGLNMKKIKCNPKSIDFYDKIPTDEKRKKTFLNGLLVGNGNIPLRNLGKLFDHNKLDVNLIKDIVTMSGFDVSNIFGKI